MSTQNSDSATVRGINAAFEHDQHMTNPALRVHLRETHQVPEDRIGRKQRLGLISEHSEQHIREGGLTDV